ncbi:MAG: MATE family efflux transporter [Clostridiales bacterium]|nr:MATE family efflux transporter [Clostridiales bacterium]
MGKTSTRDMTVGSPFRLITGFFFPLLFGLLFQQFYNMVDTIVVGKFLGVQALAGVGSTGSLTFLVLGFSVGVCNGFVIPVAQKFGEHDYRGLKQYAVNAIMLSVIVSTVLTIIVCLLCRDFLLWMNTPSDIFDYAYDYLFIVFLGIPVIFIYNVLFGIIRSLGDSRSPVMYLVFCSILNVVLDLLFVVTFKMGVSGAAWATVISQGASSLLCINYIRHCDLLILQKEDWHFNKACVKHLLSMGLPTGLQYSITALGSIILQTAVNSLGSVFVASVATGAKVSQLFCCPFDAMGSTMATYGGQNIGAKKLDRIGQGLKTCCIMGTIYAVLAFLLLYFFGGYFTQLFVDASETLVHQNAHQFLIVNSAFYIPLAFVNIVRFLIQGLGFSKQAVFAGVCEMVARTVVGFALVPIFGYSAVCFANPVAWIAADLFLFPAYAYVIKRLRHQLAQA